jgi:hypothetical protein
MRICLFLFAFSIAFSIRAQDSTVYYNASVMLSGATGQTPFWVHANQNGNIPMDGNFAQGNLALYKVYNPNNPRVFQWSAGAEVVGSYAKSEKIFISDLYVSGKIGIVEILAGQKKNITGLMDTTLTSGSLSVAGNSRPFPRVQISIANYTPLHFTNNFVSIKMSYSDGTLRGSRINYGSTPYVDHTYFHQKTLYLKFGNFHHKLNVYAGMNHQAIWGGESEIDRLNDLKPGKAYWYTISGKTLNSKKTGNHFGTIDLGGEWKSKHWSYFLYRQNIFETGSLFKVINFRDGLNGLRINRNAQHNIGSKKFELQSFLLEVIGTQNQINKSPLSGLAIYQNGNYFNSYIYQTGWSYRGKGIGTPLIPESGITKNTLPRNDSEFTNNNKFWAFHTGMVAYWLRLKLSFRATYSRNSGSYLSAFDSTKQQVSILFSAERNLKVLKGCSIYSSLSSDFGELYPNSSGVLVGIRKNGFLD